MTVSLQKLTIFCFLFTLVNNSERFLSPINSYGSQNINSPATASYQNWAAAIPEANAGSGKL